MYIFNGYDLTNTKLNAIYGNMINRCYNEIVQQLKPWYRGCTVDSVWYNPDHWGKNLR